MRRLLRGAAAPRSAGSGRLGAVLIGTAGVFGTAVVFAVPAGADTTEIPVVDLPSEVWCTPSDPALAELSGLAVLGDRLFATPDAGTDERVVELDSECAVLQRLSPPVDPYDVEDMTAGPDGRLWLGDVGDNTGSRPTVALISLDPDTGTGELHRLTYPDGPRDAETVLVSATGEPIIVTKALFGASGVYRPARGRTVTELGSPGPTTLEKVGTLALGPTDTPGGPIPGASSTLVTGGAVGADGTVVAVRTYTDVYLFHAPDGDIATALVAGPALRIAVPGESQGEAVAFTAEGDLLTASEVVVPSGAVSGDLPPISVRRGVTDLVAAGIEEDADGESSVTVLPVVAAAAAGLAAVGAALWAIRRRGTS